MALFRSIGAALEDDNSGTNPIDVRKDVGGLFIRAGVLPGGAPWLVAGGSVWAYSLRAASWVTAESVMLGTPVVCLAVGGPPLVMDGHGVAVVPGPQVVEDLARALDTAARLPSRVSTRWLESRLPHLLDEWYSRAQRTPETSRMTSR